jgi:large subunit ribosomal protein L30e
MSDLTKDLRLAIDTGEVSFGNKTVMRAISGNKAKMIVVAGKGKKEIVDDITHVCSVTGIRLVRFNGNSLELGAACGRPYSVNSLAVISEGNSGILNEEYS